MRFRKFINWALTCIAGFLITLMVAGIACLLPIPLTKCVSVGDDALQLRPWESPMSTTSPKKGYDTFTCEVIQGFGFTSFAFTHEIHGHPKIVDGRIRQSTAISTGHATEFGWPLRCFIAEDLSFNADKLALVSKSSPMYLGILIDAIFFALIVRFLPVLLRRIREIHRVWHGRCATCGCARGTSIV